MCNTANFSSNLLSSKFSELGFSKMGWSSFDIPTDFGVRLKPFEVFSRGKILLVLEKMVDIVKCVMGSGGEGEER